MLYLAQRTSKTSPAAPTHHVSEPRGPEGPGCGVLSCRDVALGHLHPHRSGSTPANPPRAWGGRAALRDPPRPRSQNVPKHTKCTKTHPVMLGASTKPPSSCLQPGASALPGLGTCTWGHQRQACCCETRLISALVLPRSGRAFLPS